MSLRAILECAIHVDAFRNIDLFQQGLYHLRVSISQEMNNQSLAIVKESSFDSHNIIPSRILDQESAYCSNSFLVKYCDEEVKIGDICVFRAEIYLGPHFHSFPLDIEVKLMFFEASANSPFERFKFSDVNINDFSEISSAKLTVHNPCLGVHEYFPLLFDEMHFSTVDLVVHTALIDYRFRPTPLMTASEEQERSLSTLSLSDREIDVEMTLAQYLFPTAALNPVLGDEEIDRVYRTYVALHEKGNEELRALLRKLIESLPDFERESLLPMSEACISPVSKVEELESISLDPQIEVKPQKKARFSQMIVTRDAEEVASQMMAGVHEISSQMCEMYHLLLQICQLNPALCLAHFKAGFHVKIKERYGESIFRDVHRVEALPLQSNEELINLHATVAKARRGNPYFKTLEPLPLEDIRLVGKPESLPILFEDSYLPINEEDEVQRPNRESTHLFVLVHGFQGNSFDMRLFKNHICLLHPNYQFLCSTANEDNTEGDIIDMGLRLSNEVKSYIQEWCPNAGVRKLSFIGHSLGGLIIRAALPFLSEYESSMSLFMTLSTPHLGYMYSESKLVDAGLWLLKKWKKSLCLTQLSMGDASDVRDSTLYRMSSFEGIQWFRHVVLFSSAQDQYAPFDSARVEVSSKVTNDSSYGCYYIEMASRLLQRVGIEKLKRIDVNFKFAGKSMDSMIGRKAHIEFLENQILMKIVVFRYPELFT